MIRCQHRGNVYRLRFSTCGCAAQACSTCNPLLYSPPNISCLSCIRLTVHYIHTVVPAGATFSRLRLSKEALPEYGASFDRLTVEATPETPSRLHIKVYPTEGKRWEVPESIVPR
jgi:hypothetical protein